MLYEVSLYSDTCRRVDKPSPQKSHLTFVEVPSDTPNEVVCKVVEYCIKRCDDFTPFKHQDGTIRIYKPSPKSLNSARKSVAMREWWAKLKANTPHILAQVSQERREQVAQLQKNPTYRRKHREGVRRSWTNERRERLSKAMKRVWSEVNGSRS